MEKLAIWDKFVSERYAGPIMRQLGSEAIFYCSAARAAQIPALLDQLKQAGVLLQIDKDERAKNHNYYLMDAGVRLYRDLPSSAPRNAVHDELKKRGARFIFLPHGSEAPINNAQFGAGDYFLAPSETILIESVGGGRFICDAQKQIILGRTPNGAEGVAAGLLHVDDDILALGQRDRQDLRAELAERLSVKFDPSLPLILYMVPQRNDIAATERGLSSLAKGANVLVKNFLSTPLPGETVNVHSNIFGPNIFQVPKALLGDGPLSFLMRYAADLNLVGLFSGSFATNVMLGLRTLPVYTKTIMSSVPPRPFNYTLFLRDLNILCVRLAHGLAPMDIEAAEMILQRATDSEYWKRYQREIASLQKHIFGHYRFGSEAARAAAFIIRRIMSVGSAAPSSLPPGAGIVDGPLPVFGLCPVNL